MICTASGIRYAEGARLADSDAALLLGTSPSLAAVHLHEHAKIRSPTIYATADIPDRPRQLMPQDRAQCIYG